MISATTTEGLRDEDDSPDLSQDEEVENEDYSTIIVVKLIILMSHM